MIRVKISGFIRRNKDKIQDLLTKLIMVAIIIFIATIILSFFRNSELSDNKNKDKVYNPTGTVIKGSDVSEEQYQKDSNIVKNFLEYCNNGQVDEAYALLTEDCKEELYPSKEDFKNYYYNNIFNKKREYNLQSWISNSKYTVYKIRYTNDMMSTGTYNKDDIYQDYITIIKDSEKQKISIGKLIGCEETNITTKKVELEATVTKKKMYISEEEYEIKIKNNTEKTILLDDLKTKDKIILIGSSGAEYGAYTNKIFVGDLTIAPYTTKTIKLKFKKNFSSNNKSEKIKFLNIIKDYDAYIQNQENYNDTTNITIKLED